MITVVTGTDTGVGKTIASAALAAAAVSAGRTVAMVKPVQTGVGPGWPDPPDADTVARLSGVPTRELVRLRDPLAPDLAAEQEGVRLPPVTSHAAAARELAAGHDEVLVEGSGGVLVRMDHDGGTLLDLAEALGARVVVVTRAGLGTLNHTELTVRAIRDRGLEVAGLVIGESSADPGLAERLNLEALPALTGTPLLGALPPRAGDLSPEAFRAAASHWLPGWPLG
ncbi:dethiobiotin synthase [Actinomycetota bacterium]